MSYIIQKIIFCCKTNKIILLCLFVYSTHILQTLNISIFRPLTSTYKYLLQDKSQINIKYFNDKPTFLRLYQDTYDITLSKLLIVLAFEKVKYSLFNL